MASASLRKSLRISQRQEKSRILSQHTLKMAKAITKKPPAKKLPAAPKPTAKRAAEPLPLPLPTTNKKRKHEEDVEVPKPNISKKRKSSKDVTPAPAVKPVKPVKALRSKKADAPLTTAPAQRLDIYAFGGNSAAELGLGPDHRSGTVRRPVPNEFLKASTVGVVQVAAGGIHCAALTFDSKILTWGGNDHYALGRDTTWDGGLVDMDGEESDDDDSDGQLNPKEATPGEVDTTEIPAGTVFTQVAAGDNATFAVTDMGLVYGWGTFRTSDGKLGFSQTADVQKRPTLIPGLKNITKIAVGSNHVLALTSKGSVFVWGWGEQGQLGRHVTARSIKQSLIPREFGRPKNIVEIGAGSDHSFAVAEDGTVYGWGSNSYGQTGISNNAGEGEAITMAPTAIASLNTSEHGKVTTITGGNHHSIAVTSKAHCLVWGRLDNFACGLVLSTLPPSSVILDIRNKPRILRIPTAIPNLEATYAASGSDHCIAISKQHQAYSWGFNNDRQTGQAPKVKGEDLDEVEVATLLEPPSVKGKRLVWAGCGGQFSLVGAEAE